MKVTDIRLRKIVGGRQIEIVLKSSEGEIYTFELGKGIARRLMRAIYLQIGIDPRLDSGHDEVVEGLERKKNSY